MSSDNTPAMTFEEFQQKLDQLEAEVALEHKLEMCGSWSVHFDVSTGLAVWKQLPCNDYRNCPACLERRIKTWSGAFDCFDDIYLETVHEHDWAKTARQWAKEGRVWYQVPIEGSRFVLFDRRYTGNERKVRRDFFSGPTGTHANLKNAKLLTLGDILVQMPRDRRVGGKLIRLTPRKKDRDGQERIEIEVIVPESGKDREIQSAVRTTLDKTAQYDPQNAEEVETHCAMRMTILRLELGYRGVKIASTHLEFRYVKSDAIRWGESYIATVLQKPQPEVAQVFIPIGSEAQQQEMTL